MSSFVQISHDLLDISKKDIFFIVGSVKSGTTWLQHILNGHPEISCKGESHVASILVPDAMKLLSRHNELISDKNKMLNQDDVNGYPTFNEKDRQHLAKTLLYLILTSQIDKPNVRIIGEKTPDNILNMQQIKLHLARQAKFIHIIRDGRDAAVSGWHHIYRDTPQEAKEHYPTFQSYVGGFAKQWKSKIIKAEQFGLLYPESYLEVRYELLHTQPDEQIKRILSFLNANINDEIINCCKEAGNFEKLSRGRNRGEENLNSHFRKGIIGDWQTLFDAGSTQQFKAQAGDLLEKLGYGW
jgi:hypothetical protein